MRHRAGRVGLDDRLKLPLRLGIPEIMEQRDAAIEGRLCRRRTGDGGRIFDFGRRASLGMGWSIDIWAMAGNAVRVRRDNASIFIAVDYKSEENILLRFPSGSDVAVLIQSLGLACSLPHQPSSLPICSELKPLRMP